MKRKAKTVVDEVNELIAKQNEQNSGESSSEETEPRITEFNDDEYELPAAQSTDFRKRNVKLLSEQSNKYKGKVSSRKELEEEENVESADDAEKDVNLDVYEESDSDDAKSNSANDINENNESDDNNGDSYEDDDEFKRFSQQMQLNSKSQSQKNAAEFVESEEDMDDEELSEAEEDDEDGETAESSNEEDASESQQIISERNREAEMQKAISVQNQLQIWERLLEMRIQTQKVCTDANKFYESEELQKTPDFEETQQEVTKRLVSLLNKLSELQVALGQQNPEFHENFQFSHKHIDLEKDEIGVAFDKFNKIVQNDFEKFRPYRNQVLLKWDDRTRLLTPGSGNKRKSTQEDYNILKKIEHTLNNRMRQLKDQNVETNELDQAPNEESTIIPAKAKKFVYDDSDFYHQQLREFIEYKASSTTNMSDVTRQYVELQKVRQTMKKKVDTRASKGRKIRYVVHKKLVNFMAPEETSIWTDQSKDELYKSLFAA